MSRRCKEGGRKTGRRREGEQCGWGSVVGGGGGDNEGNNLQTLHI